MKSFQRRTLRVQDPVPTKAQARPAPHHASRPAAVAPAGLPKVHQLQARGPAASGSAGNSMHHRPGASDSFAFPSESDPGHSFANPTAAALYAAAQAQKKTAVKRPRQVGMPKLILRRKLQARGGSRHTPTTRRQAPVKESESEEDLMSNTSKEEGEAGREAADALDMDFEGGELEAGEREGKPAARDVNSDDLEAMEHEGDQIEATEQYSTEQGESETEEDEEGSVESDLSLGTGAKRISKASRLSGKQSHSSSSGWEPSDDDSSDDSDPYPPSKQSIGIKGGTTFLRTQRAQRSAPSKHQQTEASQAQKDSAAILSALRAAPAPAPAESGQASKWDSSFAVFLSDTTAKTHTTRPGNQRQGEKNPASHALAPPIKPVKKEAPKQAQRARRGALKSSLDVIIPARAARDPGGGTVLVEMPPGLSMEGATGVVGRVTSGGQRSGLMLDLMGVQYPTEVVPLPTTLAVAHLAGATLVVDSLLNTALRAERVHSVEEESAMMGVHEMEYAPDGLSEGEMADDEAGRKRGGKAVGGRGKRGALAGRSGVKRRQKKAPAAKKGRAARKKKP